jgi:hypothetical protein
MEILTLVAVGKPYPALRRRPLPDTRASFKKIILYLGNALVAARQFKAW